MFTCTFGGALLGMWARSVLPGHHLSSESKETVKLGIGLVATMTALVLGLITASAKSSFDAMDTAVKQTAIQVLTLDRLLARYGSETGKIREELQHLIGARIETIWPHDLSKSADLDPMRSGSETVAEGIANEIRTLKPQDDYHRTLQSRALDITESLLQARWILVTEAEASVPAPFLAILLFWLTVIFGSFGLFAPTNTTVLFVLFVCALSVSCAMFLVLEMDSPFSGLIRVSADPLRYVYAHLNQ